jgi:2-oxoglutarate ferredoxin oxidoreductase subunit beta
LVAITPLSEILERQYAKEIFSIGTCPGCGGGIVAQALARAIDRAGIDKDKVVIVQGITCSGSPTNLLDYNNVWGLHGRGPAYATGLKLTRPELTVIVMQGDGDGLAIGGNHLIHAARRNIAITSIINNNFTYGRTGGQYGPTTPRGAKATSAPFGTVEAPFDVCKLLENAGATFVARGTTYHATELIDLFEKAILHHGFSAVEVITQCPVNFGRHNPEITGRTGPEMLKWMRDNIIRIDESRKEVPNGRVKKLVRGIFVDREEPEFVSEYYTVIQKAQQRRSNR